MLTGRRHFPVVLVALTHCDPKLENGPCCVKIFNKDLSIDGEAAASGSENVLLFENVCLWRMWQHLVLVGGGVFPPLCLPTATLIWFFFFWCTGDYGRGLTQGVRAGGKWDANRAVFCFMMDHPPAAETVLERAHGLAALRACRFKNTQITPDIKCCVRFCDAWAYER